MRVKYLGGIFSLYRKVVLESKYFPYVQLFVCGIAVMALFHKDLWSSAKYTFYRIYGDRLISVQSVASDALTPAVYINGELHRLPQGTPVKTSGQKVIVLISDTGIAVGNTRLKPFLWTNPHEIINGIDDDGNNCIDDVHGCNFITGDGNIEDDNIHGTHVAGIAIGIPDEAIQLPESGSNIYIAGAKFLGSNGKGYMSLAIKTIDYGIFLQESTGYPVVINASWGCSCGSSVLPAVLSPASLEDAVARAEKAGVMIVAAAGNDGSKYLGIPAAYSLEYSNVIAVGALNGDQTRADFSNKSADVAAPGVDIKSTGLSGDIVHMGGTSMSAPFVTQVVALLRQQYPRADPKQIKAMLIVNSDIKEDLQKDVKGGRVLNAKRTLRRTSRK